MWWELCWEGSPKKSQEKTQHCGGKAKVENNSEMWNMCLWNIKSGQLEGTKVNCKYASSRAGDLRKHLKKHSGEKSNKCNQCDYASSNADHLRTHSGEKSHKCNQYQYAHLCVFSSWPDLMFQRHIFHILELFSTLALPPQCCVFSCDFLSDPGKPGVRSLGPDVRPSVTNKLLDVCKT